MLYRFRGLLVPAMLLLLLVLSESAWAAPATKKASKTPAAAQPAIPPQVKLPAPASVFQTLRPDHPRLFGLPEDLARVQKLVREDAQAKDLYGRLVRSGERELSAAPVVHRLIGPRLLDMSRRCLDRMQLWGTLYRVGGDKRFADRAIREMLVAAAFPDWNPSHFLDTAEMTHALALGYDWFYDVLDSGQRQTIRTAIVEKGLKEGLKVYNGRRPWWSRATHNWNQVCNGGMTLGALAVAETDKAVAAETVCQAVASVPLAMQSYSPDGGWDEGPGYWGYATIYNVYMLAGLETALGTDFGLSRIPGFDKAGDFRIQVVGPTGLAFNFADGGSRTGPNAAMFWLARRFDRPAYAWHEREVVHGGSPMHLWWFDPRGKSAEGLPLDCHFHRTDVVMLRGAWDDPQTTFVGFKGGDNRANHSHLELGTFVLDALGQRFVLDLGPDEYNLPGYFGRQRWTYYRLGTLGQNTLVFDGKNQDPKAVAPVVHFSSSPERSQAIVDLSAPYAGSVRKALRGVALVDRKRVLLQDEIEPAGAQEIVWQFHTEAKVQIESTGAILELAGKQLRMAAVAPRGIQITATAVDLPPPQKPTKGIQRVGFRIPAKPGKTTIAVWFSPGDEVAEPTKPIPLSKWMKP